ncbi:MAG: hypothetical protein K8T90_09390 [Planctomycetes bacterium]|nr:hypothetical protein [Planctomycetota bacterium]
MMPTHATSEPGASALPRNRGRRRAALRTPTRALAVVLVGVICFAGLAACNDEPASPRVVPVSGSTSHAPAAPVQGTAAPTAPPFPQETPEHAEERLRAWRTDIDKQARAVLDRFRAVAYDPSRDAGLKSATGTIDVTVDGKSGAYEFAFSASKGDRKSGADSATDDAPTMKVVREDVGIHAGAAKQAKRFAVLATRGPTSFVLSYLPPLEYSTMATPDGHTLVVAPPFKSAMSASYRLNRETGLVEMSGTTDGEDRVRTVFHWAPCGKLWRLERAVVEDGKTTVDYEYAAQDGIDLLRRAAIQEGLHTYEAKFTWASVSKQ